MFIIEAWNNGNGYNVEVDRMFAETLREALGKALSNHNKKGNSVGDIFEIDVEIVNDDD